MQRPVPFFAEEGRRFHGEKHPALMPDARVVCKTDTFLLRVAVPRDMKALKRQLFSGE